MSGRIAEFVYHPPKTFSRRLFHRFRRFLYYRSHFPTLGLRNDDVLRRTTIVQEAVRRLPREELEARNFRIARAQLLSNAKVRLPKHMWTKFETDIPYLYPYLKEIEEELQEQKECSVKSV